MAIDTETKRRSTHGYTMTLVAPVPDAAIAATDRAHMTWLYAGLDFTPVVTYLPGSGAIVVTVGNSGAMTLTGNSATVEVTPED